MDDRQSIASTRKAKTPEGADFTEAHDPFSLFRSWMTEAEATEPADPEAMALATADERGFVFYTNCESAKGLELAATLKAALLFYWKSLGRQIRIRGLVEPTTEG